MAKIKTLPKKTSSYYWLSAILLIGVGLAAYFNSFHNAFVFDDLEFIVKNPYIRSYQSIAGFWHEGFPKTRATVLYSFAWNYQLNKLNPFGYHIFNFTVHVMTAFFVWWFVRLLYQTPVLKESEDSSCVPAVAIFTALLFIAHPIQTQAVTYITQRFASMATLFYMSGLCFYLFFRLFKGNLGLRILGFFLMIVSLGLGITSKEIIVSWPLMVLLLEVLFFRVETKKVKKLNIKYLFLGVLLLIGVVSIINTLFHNGFSSVLLGERISESHDGDVFTLWPYLLTQSRVWVKFLQLLFFPVGLNMDYDFPMSYRLFDWKVLSSITFLSVLFGLAVKFYKSYRLICFGVFWFFLTLSPNLAMRVNVIFEHKLYLVSIGFCLALSAAVFCFVKNKRLAMAILGIIIIVFAVMTHFRNRIWRSELSLWQDVVKKSPNKSRPNQNLGKKLIDHGKYDLAISFLNKAIEADDKDHKSFMDRGVAYYHKKMYEFALSDLNKAVDLKPDYHASYSNRGLVWIEKGRIDLALKDYQMALKIKPTFQIALVNRGNLLARKKKYKYALKDYSRAIELNPEYAYPYNARGITYFKLNKIDLALKDFNKAAELDPSDPKVFGNRGYYYLRQEQYDLALADLSKAISLDKYYVEAYNNLGSVYFKQKKFKEAMAEYNKVIEINSGHSKAYHNRGVILSVEKQYGLAIKEYTKAIERNPKYLQAYWSRALAYKSDGQYKLALADLDKVGSLGAKVDERVYASIRALMKKK